MKYGVIEESERKLRKTVKRKPKWKRRFGIRKREVGRCR
jgi:hypothetical protein